MIPTDTINKLDDALSSLIALCETFSEQQWKTSTQLPGWSVQDNVSHIIGTEKRLQGVPQPRHKASPRDYVKNPIGASNEDDVDARRHLSGAQVLDELRDITALRLHTFRSADESYFTAEAMTPTGPGTVADFLHIRVMDIWAHEQDIRRALFIPGHDDGACAEHSVDRLIRTIPIVVGKRAATPEGCSVTVSLTGPVVRDIHVTVRNGRAEFDTSTPESVLARVAMDSNTFIELAMGRASGDECRPRVDFSGDTALCERIINNFNMMI